MVTLKPVILPIGLLQDEIYCIPLFEVRVKGRGVTEAWPILAEVKSMIPYSRTKWALVNCEVLCFLEADSFASDTVKVGKIGS